ncbi:tRNA A37 threonylcarbamoyladenosine dehydratase [Limnobacter thiooxidans]|uniref:tRNA threonylcarbamoyladenosine dehydratase n=1 Tax=Limnobacter thiooxidans TaxID=131080 RepID=A0AA86JHF6_9BURK|nr:tRNA threonylcarbamoyladenosine dehydratase [Limnobacter sp.]MCZ8014976.1 tRNA threonylcarbamoyladenosine dehydratase [Limnobacter sp.]RZS40381.1 tRNA A37 threonylcarbamoyladenosine dehydratase [Limnobacter thiooxidans]BET27186.1 tRNA threonylcarbamoyladenosine dehydratase [Limnobacter thiooxidans]
MSDGALTADLSRRFGGLDRLYGEGAYAYLNTQVHAMVVGVGGVGSWAAEALARSGVGRITLVDLDHVAESNINRQIQACDATLGQEKIKALTNHIHSYFPSCEVTLVDAFLEPENAQDLLTRFAQSNAAYKVLLDCCDNVRAKVAMVNWAKRLGISVVLSGSAGGKSKPWLVQPADLRDTTNDPLLAKVRYTLRREHGYSKDPKKKLGVSVFYSAEQVTRSNACEPSAGLNCAGYGSVVTVTATMGMQMAAWAISQAISQNIQAGLKPSV